jgi:Protein of unknown function (DUF3775)
MPELEINSDTVCFLIAKAREFHAKEEVVLPDIPDSPSEDWALQVLADHADDATYQEFRNTVNDLEPDQQQQLVALLWLGRGEYELDEWDDVLTEARRSWTKRTAEYLIAHPLLADFLDDALEQFGYSCED